MLTKIFRAYSKPRTIDGVASVIDLGGIYKRYNTLKNEVEADYFALLSDWEAIGMDIKDVIEKEKNDSTKKQFK